MEASALPAPAGLGRHPARGRLLRLRSDEQLVALFRLGHDEAFGVIHDRYRRRLFAYTRQMLAASRADAEDALQDVFVRAWFALRADDRPLTLRAWLYRVAHNRCVDQLRRPAPAPADLFDAARAPMADPLAECERREDLRRLVADLRRLAPQQRSALLMRELEGLSYREIADALLVSVPAVKSLLVRARVALAEAGTARDTACGVIRADLAGAQERGVRASGRARRHLRDCGACREYRAGLRGARDGFAALCPGEGPLAGAAKLLGLGAGGSGAATLGGGAATVTATKVAALVCCAALAGGAATVQQLAAAPAARPHSHARAHARAGAPAPPPARPAPSRAIDPAAARPAGPQAHARPRPHERAAPAFTTAPATAVPAPDPAGAPPGSDPRTGGALAPDEPAPPAAGAPPAGTDPAPPPADAGPPAATTTPAAPAGISPSPSTHPPPPSSTNRS